MELQTKKTVDLMLGTVMLGALRLPVTILGSVLSRDHGTGVRGDILCIKMQGGGSLVIALPALLGMRRRYPDSRLCLLTSQSVRPFAEALGVFDEIICLNDRSVPDLFASALGCLPRCFSFDTVVDLEVYSRMTTVFSTITTARNRIGFFLENTFWRRGFHTHLVFLNRYSGIYHFYDEVAQLLGAQPLTPEECSRHLHRMLPPVSATRGGRRICIGHACSEMGRERMLSPRQWVEVFRSKGFEATEFLFLGSKADLPGAQAIIDLLGQELPGISLQNLCGELSLLESISRLSSSDEFWGIDSALLHFARLLTPASLSFWGPTSPDTRLRNVEGHASEIYYNKVPCSPCIHVAEEPPCKGRNICIDSLLRDAGTPGDTETLKVEARFPRVDEG